MGYYAALQVYRPGGILNAAGTPNLLRDLSLPCYQAQWTDQIQGGLDKAQFDCTMAYEAITDIVFGNWIMWAILGAELSSNASASATSVVVTNLQNFQVPTVSHTDRDTGKVTKKANLDLVANDLVVVTDGVNAELFIVESVSGYGPWTINFKPAWGNVQVATAAVIAQDVPQGNSYVYVYSAKGLSTSKPIAIGSDGYRISSISGKQPNGFYQVNLTTQTANAYAQNTPISNAGVGATSFEVDTPGGSGNAGLYHGATVAFDSGWTNGEQATISALNGAKGITLSSGLANPHGAGAPIIFEMSGQLQNNYTAGSAIVARVQYQGYINRRIRTTDKQDHFSIEAWGFFNLYNFLIDGSTVQEEDSCDQLRLDAASYSSTRPQIIVNDTLPGSWLATSVGIKVNVQAMDQTFVELIDTILRQENGNSTDVQFAAWVPADRQLRHLPIATGTKYVDYKPPHGHSYVTPTYYLTLEDGSAGLDPSIPCFGDTIAQIQTTDMDGTNLMNAAIVTGASAPTGSSIYNANTTTLAQACRDGSGTCTVTSVPSTWVNDPNSGLYLLFARRQSVADNVVFAGYEGTNCIVHSWAKNNGYIFGIGTSVEMITKLAHAYGPNSKSFQVQNAAIFSTGQEITLTPTGTEETLTIQSIDYNTNTITTTTACKKNHSALDIVCLAANGSGQGPRILVEVPDSIYGFFEKQSGEWITGFGWFEGTLTSEDIYDEEKLKNWAGQQLKVLAYPVTNSQVQLTNTAARITGRDLVQIGSFNDGSNLVQNVSSVQYNATAADQNISATVNLGVLSSTAAGVIRQIAKQRTNRERYHLQGTKGQKQGHAHGLTLNQTGANQVTIDAGTVFLNGNAYAIPAATITLSEGETRWGAACGPGVTPGTESIVELPHRFWNGRKVYSHSNVYQIAQAGDEPQLVASFSGVPLYKLNVRNGYLVGQEPLFDTKGITLKNLPAVTTPSAPTLGSGATISPAVQSNGYASDIRVQAAVNNFPTDGSCDAINVYIQTNGNSSWELRQRVKVAGLPQPSQDQNIDVTLTNLALGNVVAIAITFSGFNYESPMLTLVSAQSTGTPPFSISAPIQMLSSAPTPGSNTPTPLNASGTIGIYSGGNVNELVWLFTTASGWRPILMQG